MPAAERTTMAPPTQATPAAPSAPIAAPVCLTEVNTLDCVSVVLRHIWQEYHWKVTPEKYTGKTDDDRRVMERTDGFQTRIAKKTLNVAFCETAIVTVDAEVPDEQTLYMRWWLEDADGGIVAEHPDFTKANYDAKKPAAKLSTAKHAWRWDGRRTLENKHRVFMRNEPCLSRIMIKSESGKSVALGTLDSTSIEVQGEPYRVLVAGVPKSNDELRAELAKQGSDPRWLSKSGYRISRDCWIKIYRGKSGSPGHMVFLGHGAIEAADDLAIATPHDKPAKAWIRPDRKGEESNYDVCQIEDEGVTDGQLNLPTLTDGSGTALPPPKNPMNSHKTSKAGVQGHWSYGSVSADGGRSFPAGQQQSPLFLFKDSSQGCTTVNREDDHTPDKPGAFVDGVKSINPAYGRWGSAAAPGDNASGGPKFVNKQNKRDRDQDALLEDEDSKPLTTPPIIGTIANHLASIADEPLHMQPTFQQALWGGFLGPEIPLSPSVADEPDADPKADCQARIRCDLRDADPGTMYWQYHRLVPFGHESKATGATTRQVTLWVPRVAQRKWNGHWRNLVVRGHCEYAWFLEIRGTDGSTKNGGWIGTKPGTGHDYTALDDIGRFRKSVTFPPLDLSEGSLGDRYYSLFKYRIKLDPQPNAAEHVWEPLGPFEDMISAALPRANSLGEKLLKVGASWYLVGSSELELLRPMVDLPPPGEIPA